MGNTASSAPAYTTHEVHSNVQQIFRPKQETILSNTRYQVDFSKHPSLVFHPEPFPEPFPGPPKPRPGPHGPLPIPPKPIPGPYGPLPGPIYNGIRVERNACQNVNAGVRGHPDSVKCCTTSTLTRDFKNHNTGETSSTTSTMHTPCSQSHKPVKETNTTVTKEVLIPRNFEKENCESTLTETVTVTTH